jgi:hypothetical protein
MINGASHLCMWKPRYLYKYHLARTLVGAVTVYDNDDEAQ